MESMKMTRYMNRWKPAMICFLFLLSAWGEASESDSTSKLKNDASIPTRSKITSISIDDFTTNTATPITLGQPFKKGDIPQSFTLIAKNSSGKVIPLQLDKKALHKDGSLRHGIISIILKNTHDKNLSFFAIEEKVAKPHQQSISKLINSGVSAKVLINTTDKTYSAELNPETLSNPIKSWLNGPIVGEWVFKVPFKTTTGDVHKHLQARFNVRNYTGQNNTRIEIVVENTKLLWSNAKDIAYDLQIIVGDEEVLAKQGLYHFNHARWRKIFWWGNKPQIVHIKHDIPYLIATKAVPNYDQSITITDSALMEDLNSWNTKVGMHSALKASELMGSGLTYEYMPGTGGRPDLGPLPRWAVRYLLSMDERGKTVTMGTADQAGSFRIHIRDPKTDLPISLDDYPEATVRSVKGSYIGCTSCPKAEYIGLEERLPYSNNAVYTHADTAHQPSLAYLPYLVTGDYYYLEEMQFWTAYNPLPTVSSGRGKEKGLFKFQQIRGMAWSLRKLSRVAYITPDSHPKKAYWEKQLINNIDWLKMRYVDNPKANKLGILTHEYALFPRNYSSKIFVGPWLQDFLTTSLQQINDFEYSEIKPVLDWQARFPVSRLTAPGYCWIAGAPYQMAVADSAPSSPNHTTSDEYLYPDMATIYQATVPAEIRKLACASQKMANALSKNVKEGRFIAEPQEQPARSNTKYVLGEMIGYSSGTQGYPSILQAAVASAVDAGIPNADQAWKKINNRKKKPDYGQSGPEFAIVPRAKAITKKENVIKKTTAIITKTIVSKTPSKSSKIIKNLVPHTWTAISVNTLADVDPCPSRDCGYIGSEGQNGMLDDWTGGIFASEEGELGGLVVWGGGHRGYYGNEVYFFDLKTRKWSRKSEPTVGQTIGDPSTFDLDTETCLYYDGNPVAQHTYDAITYIPTTRQFFLPQLADIASENPGNPDKDCGSTHGMTFNFTNSTWTKLEQPTPTTRKYNITEYDKKRNAVWVWRNTYGRGGLAKYDVVSGQWTTYNPDDIAPQAHSTGAIDPERDLLVVAIFEYAKKAGMHVKDLAYPDTKRFALNTTGDTEIEDASNALLGFEWVPSLGKFVAWSSGSSLYYLTPPAKDWQTAPWVWKKVTLKGIAPPDPMNGPSGKFQVAPELDIAFVVTDRKAPVYAVKLTNPD
jgi:hypothetical protein